MPILFTRTEPCACGAPITAETPTDHLTHDDIAAALSLHQVSDRHRLWRSRWTWAAELPSRLDEAAPSGIAFGGESWRTPR